MKSKQALLVTRDGEIDDEYYDQAYREIRREALRMAGKDFIHNLVKGSNIIYHKALDNTLYGE